MRSIGSKRNCRVANTQVAELRAKLAAALRDALKARDPRAVDALRSLISAIANAEAVDDRGEPWRHQGLVSARVTSRVASCPHRI